MEIATVRRTLNHTLTELKRAIDRYAVAVAADLYALAWQQAAGAPPSETREQRRSCRASRRSWAPAGGRRKNEARPSRRPRRPSHHSPNRQSQCPECDRTSPGPATPLLSGRRAGRSRRLRHLGVPPYHPRPPPPLWLR